MTPGTYCNNNKKRFFAHKEKDSNLRGVMLTKRITVFFKCMSWEGIENRVLLRGFSIVNIATTSKTFS